jgi:hypothetical protein
VQSVLVCSCLIGLILAVVAPELGRIVDLHARDGRILSGLLLAILFAVALGLGSWMRRGPTALGIAPSLRRRVLAAVVVWAAFAIPSWREPISWLHVLFGALTGWLAPLAGISATLALAWVWSRKPADDEPRPRPFSPPSWIAAIAALGLAVLIAHLALEGLPHVPDEVAYRFDAAVFAQGRRFGASPPLPAAFPPAGRSSWPPGSEWACPGSSIRCSWAGSCS